MKRTSALLAILLALGIGGCAYDEPYEDELYEDEIYEDEPLE